MLRELVELLVPSCCAGCGSPGSALCVRCRGQLIEPKRINKLAGLPPMYALAEYDGAARRAVIAYKERGRRELATAFGELFAEALAGLPAADLVPAPSRPAAARRRGGQHMLLVARHAGRAVRPVLSMDRRVRDSLGLDPQARAQNLAGRLRCAALVPGTKVILLDDVITTGATAAACCKALTSAGARVVAVLALTAT